MSHAAAQGLDLGFSIHVQRPIIQAPIGHLGSLDLVAAVSNAGGLGTLALAWTDPRTAVRQVSALMERTSKPFAVNFVLAFEPEALAPVLEAGVRVVTFSWGATRRYLSLVHSFGAAVAVQVGSLDDAKRALDAGCEAVICQGVEAGGHVQSSTPLRSLLTVTVEEARGIPVIAAGGLVSGQDIAEVVSLGACGVMLGTRFVATRESSAHDTYKSALVSARREDTVLTKCFDGGWPRAQHRVLRNNTLTRWEASGCGEPGHRPGEGDIVAKFQSGDPVFRYDITAPTSEMHGDILACCLYAGEGVGKITTIPPAGNLVAELWSDALASLATLQNRSA